MILRFLGASLGNFDLISTRTSGIREEIDRCQFVIFLVLSFFSSSRIKSMFFVRTKEVLFFRITYYILHE